MSECWAKTWRCKRLLAVLVLLLAVLVLGPWLAILLLQIALVPLLLMALPYLKMLPVLYSFRLQRLLAQHYLALAAAEQGLEQSSDVSELRARLHELDRLHQTLRGLTSKLPATMHAAVYHWRLHIDLVRRHALDRLHSLENATSRPVRPARLCLAHARHVSLTRHLRRRIS